VSEGQPGLDIAWILDAGGNPRLGLLLGTFGEGGRVLREE
jgi:hypothetical protein